MNTNLLVDKILKEMVSRLTPQLPSLGVEISDNFAKFVLVKYESDRNASILDYCIIDLSPKGDTEKTTPLSAVTHVLEEKRLFSAKDAKVLISGPDVDSKRITLPYMPKEEMQKALRLQAKEHFLLNINESMLDFQVLQESVAADGTKNIEIMAHIAKTNLIHEKVSLFNDTKVQPAVVIPVGYALCNIYKLYKDKGSQGPVALIDIGANTATIVIIKDDKVRFIRQLGYGGEDFTAAMSGVFVSDKGKLELSLQQAESLKKELGIPDESTKDIIGGVSATQTISMLRPVLEKLSNDIKRSIDYYASEFNEGAVSRIILSGGTSKLKNISSELSQRLSITTEPMDVPEGLNIKLSPQRLETFKSDFPMLAPAIGAALSNPEGLNLIPEPYKHRQIKAIQKISIRLVFVISALILIVLHLFNSAQEGVFKRLLAAKQPQWEKLQEVGNLHSKIAQKNAMVNQVLKDQVPLYNIFKALSNLVPREIYLQRITIKDGTRSMSMQGIALETPQTAEVIIANFIKQLESSPFFNNVLLASSSDTEIDSKKAVEFEINCGLGKR